MFSNGKLNGKGFKKEIRYFGKHSSLGILSARRYSKSQESTGDFVDGLEHGTCKMIMEIGFNGGEAKDHSTEYHGAFVKGKKHGKGTGDYGKAVEYVDDVLQSKGWFS